MISIAVHTLGCKLNQAESEALAAAFGLEGFRALSWDAEADIFLINTCTVTSKAEQKARRLIRAVLREHRRSCVIVTGCYAQLELPALEALGREEGRLFVVPGNRKSALLDLPRFLREAGGGEGELPALLRRWEAAGGEGPSQDRFRFSTGDAAFRSRPFLKIQDGCGRACSYCRVPLARGGSVSLAAPEVLARLRVLEEHSFAEAVLTGVDLGQYLSEGLDLAGLLRFLLKGTRTIALRLSSLEPESVRPALLEILGEERVRPHFHLSVQSGSGRVLEHMRRPYLPADVERLAEKLRALKDDPFLSSDMITGFPGESAGDFQESLDLCRRIGFAWIHAFPYSRRPGTEAALFPDSVPEREAVSRVEELTALARRGRSAYTARWVGRIVEAIPEIRKGSSSGYASAVSSNYLKLKLLSPPAGLPPGRSLRCRLTAPAGPGEDRFDASAEPL